MRWVKLLVLWIVVVAIVSGFTRSVSGFVEIGTDEHYEVTKGLLWANGFRLYQQVWNDQPPLHTVLLGLCFKVFGASIGVARTLAIAFGLSLVTGCWVLVKRQCGVPAAFLAVGCLLAAPQVLQLSISAMLEVPAIGTALWAFWPILRWKEDRQWPWLALSGALVAVSLHIKLTAAVLTPALATEVLVAVPFSNWREWARATTRVMATWLGCLLGVYVSLAVALGSVPLEVLWASHFSLPTAGLAGISPAFWPQLWGEHTEAVWTAGAGIAVLVWGKDLRRLSFPLVWLLTATAVQSYHRPWWSYYYLHLAVPLAVLSACGIAELVRGAWNYNRAESGARMPLSTFRCLGAASVLLALAIGYGAERLFSEIRRIHRLPRIGETLLIEKMREYADRARWVYTQQTIYPFHAGLMVLPELAVLPAKRFWSGQVTDEQVWATVRRHRPDLILLDERPLNSEVSEFLGAAYTVVYAAEGFSLHVAKSLPVRKR